MVHLSPLQLALLNDKTLCDCIHQSFAWILDVGQNISKHKIMDTLRLLCIEDKMLLSLFTRRDGIWEIQLPDTFPEQIISLHQVEHLNADQLKEYCSRHAANVAANMAIQGPLIRFSLLTCSNGVTKVLIVANHLVFDGHAIALLFRRLAEALHPEGAVNSRCVAAGPFESWTDRLKFYADRGLKRDVHTWASRPWSEITRFPLQQNLQSHGGLAGETIILDEKTVGGLLKIANATRTSIVDVMLAIVASMTFSLAGGTHISISLWENGRTSTSMFRCIAPFAYYWPMIIEAAGNRQEQVAAAAHARNSSVPKFGYLLGRFGPNEEVAAILSNIPKSQFYLNFLTSIPALDANYGGNFVVLPVKHIVTPDYTQVQDVVLHVMDRAGGLAIYVEYSTCMFSDRVIRSFCDYFGRFAREFANA